MADQRGDVDGRHGFGDRPGVVGEARELVGLLAAEQVQRRRRIAVEGDRREADAAVAGDDRGDALADLRQHVRGVEDDAVVMGVGVDEARGERPALEVVLGPSGARRDGAGRPDGGDAVAGDGDVAGKGRRRRCRRRSRALRKTWS